MNDNRPDRGSLRWFRGALMAAAGFMLISVESAYADLVRYKYVNSAGASVELPASTGFISPSSGVSFLVSGGVDRKLRIAVTAKGASTPVFSKESTKLLGATDVISYAGKTYYAEEFASPRLPDGDYTVKTDILSNTGTVVQSENVNVIVDTTGPNPGIFYPRPYTTGNPVLTGDVWKLGLASGDALTFSSFVLEGFSDTSGIAKIVTRVYRETGVLYKEQNVLFSEETKSASIQYRSSFFPTSDLDEVFGVEFIVTDKAGNSTTTKRQKVMFDNYGNTPKQPFGVYDPSVTTELAPGLTGFVPYVAGASVKTNPIRLAWKIAKYDWHTYRLGGFSFYNSLGENKVVGEDAENIYLVGSLPYGSENGNYFRWVNFGAWGGLSAITYNLTLAPEAPRTPVIKNVEYYFSDIGWSSYTGRVVTPKELPVTVTKVRYTAEPRPFAQIATHKGTCTIPAGQTQCEITTNLSLAKGTSGYLHDQAVLKSADGLLTANGQWANVWWNDQYLPILNYTYNPDSMILTLKVRQPQQGNFLNNLIHKAAWLEDAAGKKLTVTQKLTSSVGENFEYEFDLKTVPNGIHSLVAAASENLGAETRLPLFDFDSDRVKPEIAVNKDGGDSIDTLDKLSFTVTDNKDPAPKILSVILSGGPANQSIALSYRKNSTGSYGLEYPVLFPSLAAGERYTLTVTAKDAQENVGTGSTSFLYGPPMAGIIGHQGGLVNVPATPVDFRRNDGSMLINSEPLKLADGSTVSGIYQITATVRNDAVSSLKIGGINVKPGATVTLGQLDFTQSGGKITLPVIPVESGIVGSNPIIISTSAPNSPVVYASINTWMPKTSLDIDNQSPIQALTTTKVKIVAPADNACQVTTSLAVAQSADPILSPICLVEWTNIPRGLKAVAVKGTTYPMTQLEGRATTAGKQKVSYTVSVYNKGSDKVLLTSSEQVLDVQPAQNAIAFAQSLEGKTIKRIVDDASVTMLQLSGPSCVVTGIRDEAVAAGMNGTGPVCLVQFTQVPDGLRVKSSNPLELAGAFTKVGDNPINWTASVFDSTGSEIVLQQGQSIIHVVHPGVKTTLSFKVNESSSADETPEETDSAAWASKTYSVVTQPVHGEASATTSGFTYTPTTGFVGADSFVYKVLDASGMEAQGAASITVEKYNYPPTFAELSIATREGKASEPTEARVEDLNLWDSHALTILSEPQNGSLEVVESKVVYTPAPGFYGSDAFTFEAVDQGGLKVEGLGRITVSRFNLPPSNISPTELTMYSGRGGVATLDVYDPNLQDNHVFTIVRQPGHGTASMEGRRLVYDTQGSDDTWLLVRATDEGGLYLDQRIDLKLIPYPSGNNIIRIRAPISFTPTE